MCYSGHGCSQQELLKTGGWVPISHSTMQLRSSSSSSDADSDEQDSAKQASSGAPKLEEGKDADEVAPEAFSTSTIG